MAALWHRLEELRGGEGQDSFARRAGVGKGTIDNILNGQPPSMATLIKISGNLGVPLIYLLGGDSSQLSTVTAAGDVIPIRRLAFRAGAGTGSLILDDEAGTVDWPSGLLASAGIAPDKARHMVVRGDSMTPTIGDGDELIVNTGERQAVDGRIYVLTIGDEAFVKRLRRAPGRLELISDNPLFAPVPVDPDAVVRIVGRVRWIGRQV